MNTRSYLLASIVLPCAMSAAQSPFGTTRFVDFPQYWISRLASGDIDGDGDLDLLVARDYQAVAVLINDGNGRFVDDTAGRFTSPAVLDNHCIDLADVDGDGDLDALLGNEDFVPNYLYLNDGTGVFTDVSATALPAQADNTQNQVVADFDGDGDLDWLALNYGGSRYYENNGVGVFSDQTATRLGALPINLGLEWLSAPPARDLDGDGDLDVLVPGVGGLLINQNGVLVPAPVQLPAGTIAFWLEDVDGDGDVDVIADQGRQLFANQGNGTFVDVSGATLGAMPPRSYGCFDVDRDGYVDLVGLTAIGFNDGTGTFGFAASSQTPPYAYVRADVAADYDGDGDLDLPGMPNFLHHVDAPAAPQIGAPYLVHVHSRPVPISPSLLMAAFGSATVPLGAAGTLRLDPASAVVIASQFGASPLTVSWTLPNDPTFVGTALHYQGAVLDPLVGIQLTNTFVDVIQ